MQFHDHHANLGEGEDVSKKAEILEFLAALRFGEMNHIALIKQHLREEKTATEASLYSAEIERRERYLKLIARLKSIVVNYRRKARAK